MFPDAKMYDLAIVGGGPAGATLARLMAGRCKVILIEKRFILGGRERNRGKCCGGLLSPDAQEALAELGLGIPDEVLVEPKSLSVRVIDVSAGLTVPLRIQCVNVDRGRFERWLLSLVPPEVEIQEGRRLAAIEDEGHGFRLHLVHGDRAECIRARLLVGADGADSIVRRTLAGEREKLGRYIAIQEWWQESAYPPDFAIILDPSVTDFYAWTIPKDDALIVGASLCPRQQPLRRMERLRETLMRTGYRLGRRILRHGALLSRPRRVGDVILGAGRLALVGEAAGLVSPTSGEGISYALRSASALAGALSEGYDGFAERYARATRPLRLSILTKKVKSVLAFNPSLRRVIMRVAQPILRAG